MIRNIYGSAKGRLAVDSLMLLGIVAIIVMLIAGEDSKVGDIAQVAFWVLWSPVFIVIMVGFIQTWWMDLREVRKEKTMDGEDRG